MFHILFLKFDEQFTTTTSKSLSQYNKYTKEYYDNCMVICFRRWLMYLYYLPGM